MAAPNAAEQLAKDELVIVNVPFSCLSNSKRTAIAPPKRVDSMLPMFSKRTPDSNVCLLLPLSLI